MEFSRKLFPVVSCAYCSVPTYDDGTCGYVLASLSSVSEWGQG